MSLICVHSISSLLFDVYSSIVPGMFHLLVADLFPSMWLGSQAQLELLKKDLKDAQQKAA